MTGRRPPFPDVRPPTAREGASYDAEARRAEAPASLPEAPDCPFCAGVETELMNAFGSHASVATYWCRRCRSPFETMKWRGRG